MGDTLQKYLELNLIMRSGNIVTRLNYGYFGATIPAAAYFYAIGYYYGLICVWLLLWIIMHLVITMDLLIIMEQLIIWQFIIIGNSKIA